MRVKTGEIADFRHNIKKIKLFFLSTKFWLVHTEYN